MCRGRSVLEEKRSGGGKSHSCSFSCALLLNGNKRSSINEFVARARSLEENVLLSGLGEEGVMRCISDSVCQTESDMNQQASLSPLASPVVKPVAHRLACHAKRYATIVIRARAYLPTSTTPEHISCGVCGGGFSLQLKLCYGSGVTAWLNDERHTFR